MPFLPTKKRKTYLTVSDLINQILLVNYKYGDMTANEQTDEVHSFSSARKNFSCGLKRDIVKKEPSRSINLSGWLQSSSSVSMEPVSIADEFSHITPLSPLNTETVPTLYEMMKVMLSTGKWWTMFLLTTQRKPVPILEEQQKHQTRILDVTGK